jgi:hypothetical protein
MPPACEKRFTPAGESGGAGVVASALRGGCCIKGLVRPGRLRPFRDGAELRRV